MSLFHFWLGSEYQKNKVRQNDPNAPDVPFPIIMMILIPLLLLWIIWWILSAVGITIPGFPK